MKKICFIAQFPPPVHGLSKAVETLFNSRLSSEYEFEKVDITNNKKFLSNLNKISKSDADLFYFTISQTKGGNLRDLMILKRLEKHQGNDEHADVHYNEYEQQRADLQQRLKDIAFFVFVPQQHRNGDGARQMHAQLH